MENIRTQFICKNQIKKGKSGTREMLKFLKKNFSVALMIDQRVSEVLNVIFLVNQPLLLLYLLKLLKNSVVK